MCFRNLSTTQSSRQDVIDMFYDYLRIQCHIHSSHLVNAHEKTSPCLRIILLHQLRILRPGLNPPLNPTFQDQALHGGILLLLKEIREPSSGPRTTTITRAYTTSRSDDLPNHASPTSIAMTQADNKTLTTIPDDMLHASRREQSIQGRKSRIQTVRRQIDRPADRTALTSHRSACYQQPTT